MTWLRYLLVAGVIAFGLRFVDGPPVVIFVLACLSLIPLAGYLGEATEHLAVHTGPRIGGLLNATLGNAAELIITIVALRAGLIDLVKASITGSIIGNVLLILGFSILVGGLKNGTQRFDRDEAGTQATMMMLAVVGLMIPAIFAATSNHTTTNAVEYMSIGVAIALMVIYVLSLIYSLRNQEPVSHADREMGEETSAWSIKRSVIVLAASTIGIVFMSELLVGVVESVTHTLGVSELFLGVMIIPIVGNAAEHIVGVQVAAKNKMDLSLAISLGSSQQIALFVAPLLVFVSILVGHPMNLIFNPFELAGLAGAVIIATLIAIDGRSNWLEGAQLLIVYIILGLAFFFLG